MTGSTSSPAEPACPTVDFAPLDRRVHGCWKAMARVSAAVSILMAR